MADLNILIKQIDNLTLLEAAQLCKMLREKWGVSGVRPITVRSEPSDPSPDHHESLIDQSEFDVVLLGFEGKKIKVIRAVRKLTTLGLREAKRAVEDTPTTLKEGVSKEEAEAVKAEIEQAGGQVEIK